MHKEELKTEEGAGDSNNNSSNSIEALAAGGAGAGEDSDEDAGGGAGVGAQLGSLASSALKAGGSGLTNAMSAMKRFFSNNLTDGDKQDAIDVFLGNYIPAPLSRGRRAVPIWDLDTGTLSWDSDDLYGFLNTNFYLV